MNELLRKTIMPPHFKRIASTLYSWAYTPTNNGWIIALLRWCMNRIALLRAMGEYRKGNILAAQETIQRSFLLKIWKHPLANRVHEMASILKAQGPYTTTAHNYPYTYNKSVILALNSSLPHSGTGYTIRSHHIAKQLAASGLKISVTTRLGYPWNLKSHSTLPHESFSEVDEVCYLRLPEKSKILLGEQESHYIKRYAQALAKLAAEQNATVIHAASKYTNGLAAVQASHISGCAAVYEMRGLWHMSRAVKEPGYEKTDHYRYCEALELTAARQSHAVVCISKAMQKYLINKGIPENSIHVIPNAVETDQFKPIPPDTVLLNKFNLNGRIVVGFIGSLTGYEGLETLIQAVLSLLEKGLPLSLIIVGQGILKKSLEPIIAASPMRQHIHLVGVVPFDQVKRYYSVMDIMPLARSDYSVCRLVPPLKILEIMAMEKAVIVSDLPPLTEMVQHERTGLVCRPDNHGSLSQCIETLSTSIYIRRKLGSAARQWVQKERSWKKVAQKYPSIYEQITACSGYDAKSINK